MPRPSNFHTVTSRAVPYMRLSSGSIARVHSIERQRYYEVLRHENDGLLNLVIESLENSIDTTSKFFGELANVKLEKFLDPRSVRLLKSGATVSPLAAPKSRIRVADLLP